MELKAGLLTSDLFNFQDLLHEQEETNNTEEKEKN